MPKKTKEIDAFNFTPEVNKTLPITEKEVTPKRTIRDSVFRNLFQQKKYLLELYQSLHPEDYLTTEDDLEIVTLENVLVNQLYNDLGFLVDSRLIILVEAQSTWSVNIVVRSLIYLAHSWKVYADTHNLNMYSSTVMKLPKPEFYVVYTGEEKNKPDFLYLSKEFFPYEESWVELKMKVLTDGEYGDILNQYVLLRLLKIDVFLVAVVLYIFQFFMLKKTRYSFLLFL